ncbi:DCC1-like thiol-disulfide oxidoreductase family protein [Epilithonimonas tenax]|uniref:DCC1-like thiol-disulfide oxidoreductase family protein n=1 Tax=Epilithonimonas tenax TaxID=191577 RepID=UPI00041A4B4A|nr:DCC1-like thiol-disulfide oxidoreductase family protein [Epilithonimonas tenax]
MKTLENHILIYDNDCPMCNIYSKGFIKAGMLDENGREAFSEISSDTKSRIDLQRSKNEIALINTNGNQVIYGLESLLTIIGNSFPTLEKIARVKPLYWFLQRLYQFVSYNRKQIVPSAKDLEKDHCVPAFNLKYRLFYLAWVLFFSVFVLGFYKQRLFPDFKHNFGLALFICCMQIIWQNLLMARYLKGRIWDYLGNMMTVSLLGTLLLVPVLLFNFDHIFYCIYFGFVVFITFLEHLRRCRILKFGMMPSISWMVFWLTYGAVLLYVVSNV